MTDTLEIETEKQRRLDLLDQARAVIDGELQEMYRRVNDKFSVSGGMHTLMDRAQEDVKDSGISTTDLMMALEDAETEMLNGVFDDWESAITSHFDTQAEAAADA